MEDIPQGCIRVGREMELHIHPVYDPSKSEAVMPGPGGFVLVKHTFVPGEGEEISVRLYDRKRDSPIDWSDPNIRIFDECIPR